MEVPPYFPAYVSPIDIVMKKGGKWRKVWDGRVVNGEQIDVHFRMKGPETIMRLMLPKD
jgi:hypothetical protein